MNQEMRRHSTQLAGGYTPIRSLCTPCCPSELRRNVIELSQFSILKRLGGGYASNVRSWANQTVFAARDEISCSTICLKVYKKEVLSPMNKRQICREIEIQGKIDEDDVCQLYAAFETEESIYLVLEYVAGNDLYKELRRRGTFSEAAARRTIHSIATAVAKLHELSIIHRDLKPENILLDTDGSPKIIDFGLAMSTLVERPITRLGTLQFLAPEVVQAKGRREDDLSPAESAAYGPEVDIWAIGAIAYELLVGKSAFDRRDKQETMRAITHEAVLFPPDLPISFEARDFIHACLNKEPAERPTAAQLLTMAWFNSGAVKQRRASCVPVLGGAAASGGAAAAAAAGGLAPGSTLRAMADRRNRRASVDAHVTIGMAHVAQPRMLGGNAGGKPAGVHFERQAEADLDASEASTLPSVLRRGSHTPRALAAAAATPGGSLSSPHSRSSLDRAKSKEREEGGVSLSKETCTGAPVHGGASGATGTTGSTGTLAHARSLASTCRSSRSGSGQSGNGNASPLRNRSPSPAPLHAPLKHAATGIHALHALQNLNLPAIATRQPKTAGAGTGATQAAGAPAASTSPFSYHGSNPGAASADTASPASAAAHCAGGGLSGGKPRGGAPASLANKARSMQERGRAAALVPQKHFCDEASAGDSVKDSVNSTSQGSQTHQAHAAPSVATPVPHAPHAPAADLGSLSHLRKFSLPPGAQSRFEPSTAGSARPAGTPAGFSHPAPPCSTPPGGRGRDGGGMNNTFRKLFRLKMGGA